MHTYTDKTTAAAIAAVADHVRYDSNQCHPPTIKVCNELTTTVSIYSNNKLDAQLRYTCSTIHNY